MSDTVIHIDEPTDALLFAAVDEARERGDVKSVEINRRMMPLYYSWGIAGFLDAGGTATVVVDESAGTVEAPLFV